MRLGKPCLRFRHLGSQWYFVELYPEHAAALYIRLRGLELYPMCGSSLSPVEILHNHVKVQYQGTRQTQAPAPDYFAGCEPPLFPVYGCLGSEEERMVRNP
jgi:hypothetical protein